MPSECHVFLGQSLSIEQINFVKKVFEDNVPETVYHSCTEGFVNAWHRLGSQIHEINFKFFITAEHIESGDVVFALYCAQVPTFSFSCAESCSPLLFSRPEELPIIEKDVTDFFFPSSSGLLVVIDGADGAGKETQTRLLKERCAELSDLKDFTFPNYGGFCGGNLRDVLCQKKGPLENISTPSLGLMFTLNRLSKKVELLRAKSQGSIGLLDRYFTANFAYQGYKIPEEKRDCFIQYLESIEIDWLGLPSPDTVIYLDLPPLHALQAMKNDRKREELDANETASVSVKEQIRKIFLSCCQRFPNWWLIQSCDHNGSRRPIGDVHQLIVKKIMNKFYPDLSTPQPQLSSVDSLSCSPYFNFCPSLVS